MFLHLPLSLSGPPQSSFLLAHLLFLVQFCSMQFLHTWNSFKMAQRPLRSRLAKALLLWRECFFVPILQTGHPSQGLRGFFFCVGLGFPPLAPPAPAATAIAASVAFSSASSAFFFLYCSSAWTPCFSRMAPEVAAAAVFAAFFFSPTYFLVGNRSLWSFLRAKAFAASISGAQSM